MRPDDPRGIPDEYGYSPEDYALARVAYEASQAGFIKLHAPMQFHERAWASLPDEVQRVWVATILAVEEALHSREDIVTPSEPLAPTSRSPEALVTHIPRGQPEHGFTVTGKVGNFEVPK